MGLTNCAYFVLNWITFYNKAPHVPLLVLEKILSSLLYTGFWGLEKRTRPHLENIWNVLGKILTSSVEITLVQIYRPGNLKKNSSSNLYKLRDLKEFRPRESHETWSLLGSFFILHEVSLFGSCLADKEIFFKHRDD